MQPSAGSLSPDEHSGRRSWRSESRTADDPHIDGDGAGGTREDRVEVELGDLGEVVDETAHSEQ